MDFDHLKKDNHFEPTSIPRQISQESSNVSRIKKNVQKDIADLDRVNTTKGPEQLDTKPASKVQTTKSDGKVSVKSLETVPCVVASKLFIQRCVVAKFKS